MSNLAFDGLIVRLFFTIMENRLATLEKCGNQLVSEWC